MFNITEQTCFKILIFEIVSNKFPKIISFYLLFTFISILQPQFAFNLKPKILKFLCKLLSNKTCSYLKVAILSKILWWIITMYEKANNVKISLWQQTYPGNISFKKITQPSRKMCKPQMWVGKIRDLNQKTGN